MTSNLGSEYLLDGIKDGEITEEAKAKIDALLKRSFKPEFLNRLSGIVYFKPLSEKEVSSIVSLMLEKLKARLKDKRVGFEITPAAVNYIIGRGYDMQFGARPLKRFIEQNVETMIAKEIIAGSIKPDTTITVDSDGEKLYIK